MPDKKLRLAAGSIACHRPAASGTHRSLDIEAGWVSLLVKEAMVGHSSDSLSWAPSGAPTPNSMGLVFSLLIGWHCLRRAAPRRSS